MKRNTLSFLALMVVIVMMGACGNNAWDELPSPIVAFVSEYFPFGEVESYKVDDNGVATVQIKKGATLKFDKNYEWIDINGNGSTLPQQFLFDKLPPLLYDYIEARESLLDVYSVSRTTNIITIEFLDSRIEYDESTGTITSPQKTSTIEMLF